ncbi:MAG TPA: NAD(P)H-dependent glycerol-3-phosphate dehydrogenase [Saprospiraceae bacterium]|nr:NAD(P)H-dependent glycerol-3-phosphate dehydrogenase [Saprospiraceae bacterium]HND88130.1 NAD(P)H-dependent glycerol-3-phosphate dehydrogenase [Saprospiraceae bacterium]
MASHLPVGVLGAGSFGTAIANLLALNVDVLLFSRKEETVQTINTTRQHMGVSISPRVTATSDLAEMARRCTLIFPVVPSNSFRSMIRALAPHLRPHHIIIHGTKGFDLGSIEEDELDRPDLMLTRADVRTMSEVVLEESSVVRVGCLSGPNLAAEIMEGQPAATLVGSRFREVIQAGQAALNSRKFHVFGSYDILGAELAGALKNIVALGSGIVGGLGLGRNIQGLLIAKGLAEMIYVGKALGASSQAFIGVAGIGDLVATATSVNSRNYTFGTRLAKGETVEDIRATMPELAEGVRTLRIAHHLAGHHKLHVPIIDMLHAVVFERYPIPKALQYLMTYPYAVDVDFL